ncbi:MAG TPA: tRNA-binding protein [Clostridia bacterium]|nr:tRNA-binding protein [Clostridia bacterium]
MARFDDFLKLDIRVGEIVKAENFEKARKPSYKLWVDFGSEIGIKKASAQITELYSLNELLHRQVLGVVNFPPRQVADFMSEVLVLGIYSEEGVILIRPERPAKKGDKLG